MKRALILLILAALAGCNTMPQRIEVPVPVQCHVKAPDKPVWATDALQTGSGLYEKVRALLAEREQRIAYETQLEAASKACE
jgi:hypothetical protein